MSRARIVEEPKTPVFRQQLELTARELTRNWSNAWDYTEESSLVREIKLTLDVIDNRRELESRTSARLREEHFYTYQEMVQQKRELQYRPYRPNSVDLLKGKLGQLEREARAMRFSGEETLGRLHERLLYQIRKLKTLRQNGRGTARKEA